MYIIANIICNQPVFFSLQSYRYTIMLGIVLLSRFVYEPTLRIVIRN